MSSDRVLLTVPSRAEYAKTVRMTAAVLASRLGMTYDDVDDVRIAAEEVFVYAVDHAPDGGEVAMEFIIDENSIQICVALSGGAPVTDEEIERRASYATFILQAVCDHYELSSDETCSCLKVTKSIPVEQQSDAQG